MDTLPTDEEYKAALLQSRQAAKFAINSTMGGSCASCLGNKCGGGESCWHRQTGTDRNKIAWECGCFPSTTDPNLPTPGGWIPKFFDKPSAKVEVEVELQLTRANFQTNTGTAAECKSLCLNAFDRIKYWLNNTWFVQCKKSNTKEFCEEQYRLGYNGAQASWQNCNALCNGGKPFINPYPASTQPNTNTSNAALAQTRNTANFANPTNSVSLSCCSGGLSCVGEATCWKRIGITGVVECKCLSGNPNYPSSQGWTRYPRRAVPPTWA